MLKRERNFILSQIENYERYERDELDLAARLLRDSGKLEESSVHVEASKVFAHSARVLSELLHDLDNLVS